MAVSSKNEVLHRLPTSAIPNFGGLDYSLPPELEASAPPEARGLARDEVRLMISYRADNRVVHRQFRDLPRFLDAGDVVVINTSGTMNAAIPALRADGTQVELHLSTHLPADLWIVELRLPSDNATSAFYDASAGEILTLPCGATATLLTPYLTDRNVAHSGSTRLWIATLDLPYALNEYLERHGYPIRYSYVKQG
ncbi:MAG: S-adenosylmethionine:tRNA ribosyltransferase-isomerase, partial [Chloroflexi bacterium]|nr:S-adenosylmethionine:tRNA ribosyltransferase-isomerase [Chloroflexota bacterium]